MHHCRLTHSFSFPSYHHSIIPPFHHHKGAVPWNSEGIFLSRSTKSIQSKKNSLELFVRGQRSPQPTKTHSHEQRALIHMTSLGLAELILRPFINTIPEELWRRYRILCNDSKLPLWNYKDRSSTFNQLRLGAVGLNVATRFSNRMAFYPPPPPREVNM